MSDLIRREDAIEAVRKELVCDGRHEAHDNTCRFIADVLLSALPSADRPTGEWVSNHDGSWNCSKCGLRVFVYAKGNFCPNCGAKMVREDGEA